MIVKTGANYQADGGYIAASIVDNKIVATINDQTKEYNYYSTSEDEVSVIPILISKSENVGSLIITATLYRKYTLESGSTVYDYQNVGITTTPISEYFALSYPFGSALHGTDDPTFKLSDGSKDCEIVKRSGSNGQFLIVTGPNPIAIIDVE